MIQLMVGPFACTKNITRKNDFFSIMTNYSYHSPMLREIQTKCARIFTDGKNNYFSHGL